VPDLPPDVQAAMREWQAVTDDLVAIARAFGPARLDAGSACGGWTNRELLIHMATGYGVRIAALQAVVEGTPARHGNADDANAGNIARLSYAGVEDIVAEMMQVRGRVLVLLGRLRAEHMSAITALAEGRPLGEALASLNAHDLAHAAELRG
jgi:Mycothiol maleylpyruvate isomerase N-terminal domain